MFNAFNHPNFALPSEAEAGIPCVSVPARFGTLESTISPPTGLLGMMAGRFALVIPALCFAGLVARQQSTPRSSGTLRTDSWSFGILLTTFLIIVTALSYLSVVTLGPVLEHLQFKI